MVVQVRASHGGLLGRSPGAPPVYGRASFVLPGTHRSVHSVIGTRVPLAIGRNRSCAAELLVAADSLALAAELGIVMRLNQQRLSMPQTSGPMARPIAHPIQFKGAGVYQAALDTAWGAVFEDNGSTGYLYLTNATFDHIFDALHVYDSSAPEKLAPGEPVFLVWNPSLKKLGLYFRGRFQVAASLAEQRSCCRSGFPANAPKEWGGGSHAWDEQLVRGLG